MSRPLSLQSDDHDDVEVERDGDDNGDVDDDDGDDGDDDDDDDDDDDCRMISLLIQDCTETITEVCEQTNTYSHTTVYRQRYQKYYL